MRFVDEITAATRLLAPDTHRQLADPKRYENRFGGELGVFDEQATGASAADRLSVARELEQAVRIEWFGDEIEAITLIDPLRGKSMRRLDKIAIYPSTHYVVTPASRERALTSIRDELAERLATLQRENKLVEAQRLEQRTRFDLEMLEHMGYCHGIENYSRHLTGRVPGQPPPTLLCWSARRVGRDPGHRAGVSSAPARVGRGLASFPVG